MKSPQRGGRNGESRNDNGHSDFSGRDRNKQMYSHTLAAVSDIEKLAQKRGANPIDEKFKVMPDDSYPNTYMAREELRQEMNQKSELFHDLRGMRQHNKKQIGELRVEVLQCFGIPTLSLIREPSAYCIAVCENHAFKTDTMPPVANPMWLSKMRRACVFPLMHAYARFFVGVFNDHAENSSNGFVGRVEVDVTRLRPGCTYDVTLPLRQSAHVFTRQHQGAIRFRMYLIYYSERTALLSYIPKTKLKFVPNETMSIHCLDEKSFKNVAHVVHGSHMPGKFSMTLLKATIREINFTRIHVMRYIRRRELWNIMYWQYPVISGFVFFAWMHSVYHSTMRYVPGHVLAFLLMHLYKNYAYYGMDSPLQNGFMAPTIEEMLNALLFGTKRRRKFIQPLDMEIDENHAVNPIEHLEAHADYEEANTDKISITEIAESMRKSIRVQTYKYRLRTYKNCFLGSEAVDFLVSFGFAHNRVEAVFLGKRLAREVRLFEHVARQLDFEDEDFYYHFLEYDTKKYVIKGHKPRGKAIFKALGFLNEDELNEARGHVEFPYATGVDHARFTVKESLVIRSAEGKKISKEKEQQQDIADCADFGVLPMPEPEEGNIVEGIAKMGVGVVTGAVGVTVGTGAAVVGGAVRGVRAGVRRASLGVGSMGMGGGSMGLGTIDKDEDEPVREAEPVEERPQTPRASQYRTLDSFGGVPDDIYAKLKERDNKTLDQLLAEKDQAYLDDKFAYDSDHDVDDVIKLKRKGVLIEEKILKKPPNQDINLKSSKGDKSFARAVQHARHTAHGVMLHLFNTKTYTIDSKLFPQTLPEDNDQDTVKSSKSQRKRMFQRRSIGAEEKKPKQNITPYDKRQDEYDKILGINKYSHPNPWINRVGVIVQPIVEIVQAPLFLCRAIYNIFTWQDPILSFWFAFGGPIVVLVLYWLPYRFIFAIAGITFVGPQNYILRRFREPPDFDKLIKKKKTDKDDFYMDSQFFSSETRGNQSIKYINVEPKQVRQVVVPSSQLKYANRFYDWPPEPQYARVYASPPPRSAAMAANYDSEDESVEGTNYWFDPANLKKKKKKKKGVKRLASKVKKGTGTVVVVGGELVNRTRNTAVGAVRGTVDVTGKVAKGTAKVTKGAVKGTAKATKGAVKKTAKVTKGAVKDTAGAVKGTWFGMRNRKGGGSKYDYDNDSY